MEILLLRCKFWSYCLLAKKYIKIKIPFRKTYWYILQNIPTFSLYSDGLCFLWACKYHLYGWFCAILVMATSHLEIFSFPQALLLPSSNFKVDFSLTDPIILSDIHLGFHNFIRDVGIQLRLKNWKCLYYFPRRLCNKPMSIGWEKRAEGRRGEGVVCRLNSHNPSLYIEKELAK